MTGPTLVEFLTARLDEDEAAARASEGEHGHYRDTWWGQESNLWSEAAGGSLPERMTRADADHIARHDPARVLRDVEAKRRLIAFAMESIKHGLDSEPFMGEHTLALMALAYSDHPDYSEEWTP